MIEHPTSQPVIEVEDAQELARIEGLFTTRFETQWLEDLRIAYQAESHSSMGQKTWRAFAKGRVEMIDRVLAGRSRRWKAGVH